MGSCPDGEAVRGGGRLTARERQAPEKKERSDYRSDDPPQGELRRYRRRRKGSGGRSGRRRRSGAGSAEVRNEPEMNLRSDGAEGR